jgi:hypothetical protein
LLSLVPSVQIRLGDLLFLCVFASLREVLTSLVAASSPVIFCGYIILAAFHVRDEQYAEPLFDVLGEQSPLGIVSSGLTDSAAKDRATGESAHI